MLTRLGTPVMSGVVALAMALSMGGTVVGVALVADTTPAETEPVAAAAPDTTATFEDTDGNGVDDDCQQAVEANPDAEASAAAAVDLDKDGVISTSEAAQSDRTGGKNCNHGGYVSGVAKADDESDDEAAEDEAAAECDAAAAPVEPTDATEPTEATDPAEADAETAPNEHGKAVSEVAQSDAVGGKNCNHGGAVSEAAKADHAGKRRRQGRREGRAGRGKGRAEAERAAAKANRQHGNAP